MNLSVDPETKKVLLPVVDQALKNPDGQLRVANARNYMLDALVGRKFNYERAREVFKIAVDNSVWRFLQDNPIRRFVYRDYLKTCLGTEFGTRLADEFVRDTGAKNQRPARKAFRWLLGA
jgi:hypothetical protein